MPSLEAAIVFVSFESDPVTVSSGTSSNSAEYLSFWIVSVESPVFVERVLTSSANLPASTVQFASSFVAVTAAAPTAATAAAATVAAFLATAPNFSKFWPALVASVPAFFVSSPVFFVSSPAPSISFLYFSRDFSVLEISTCKVAISSAVAPPSWPKVPIAFFAVSLRTSSFFSDSSTAFASKRVFDSASSTLPGSNLRALSTDLRAD